MDHPHQHSPAEAEMELWRRMNASSASGSPYRTESSPSPSNLDRDMPLAPPRPPPLYVVWGPAIVVYLVIVGSIFVYLHGNLHPCIPAFVVLGGMTAIVWYEMLFWNKPTKPVPDAIPATKVIVAWLAYGLLFRGRKGDVFPELAIVFAGIIAIIFVVFSYVKMVYQKIYVSKFMAQIYLLVILFVPSSDINVAPDMETGLVLLKVTAFYLIYALSELESVRTEDTGNPYYGSVERRIIQSLWVLMTWSYAFAALFSVLQIGIIGWSIYLSSSSSPRANLSLSKKQDDSVSVVGLDVESGQQQQQQQPPGERPRQVFPPSQPPPPQQQRRRQHYHPQHYRSPQPQQQQQQQWQERTHPKYHQGPSAPPPHSFASRQPRNYRQRLPPPLSRRGRNQNYPRNGVRQQQQQHPQAPSAGRGQHLSIDSAIEAAKTFHTETRPDVASFTDE